MDSTSDLIIDSLKKEPIGETNYFIWFITDIGIVALFKKDKFSRQEAHVDKKFKNFFLYDVSNWKLKWRKINLNLKFLIFVIANGKLFNSVFSMQIFLKPKTNQIRLI